MLPPQKLLTAPFTQDKIEFFQLIAWTGIPDKSTTFHLKIPDDLAYRDAVQEGLEQAVAQGAADVLSVFWSVGAQPYTETLRSAVTEAGCNEKIVKSIVGRVLSHIHEPTSVDLLDPAIWAWADKARAKEGKWLMELLRKSSRLLLSRESEAQRS